MVYVRNAFYPHKGLRTRQQKKKKKKKKLKIGINTTYTKHK